MVRFDEIAVQDTVIKTKLFVEREQFSGKDRVVASSTGGTGTLRVRADPKVVAEAKLMQRTSKSPSIRAGGDAVRLPTDRVASSSAYLSAYHTVPPEIQRLKPTRLCSLERARRDANRAPSGSDPRYFTPIMPPPPPTPRNVRTGIPPQPRPPPKEPPKPPPPPPAPKRNLAHY